MNDITVNDCEIIMRECIDVENMSNISDTVCNFRNDTDIVGYEIETVGSEIGSVNDHVLDTNNCDDDLSSTYDEVDMSTFDDVEVDETHVNISNNVNELQDVLSGGTNNRKINENLFENIKALKDMYYDNVVIGHINVNSLRSKFIEIDVLLTNSRFEILALSETKLDSSYKDACFNVKNYTLFRQDKRSNSGGLVIYVKKEIPSTQGPVNLCSEELECMSVELNCKGNKILVMNMYKNPKMTPTSFQNKFTELTEDVLNRYDNVIIIGDLNFNMLESNTLSRLCPTLNLTNVITEPTCFKSNNPTLIDVMLVTKRKKVIKNFSLDTGISDFHNLIGGVLKIHTPLPAKKIIYYRKLSKINYQAMINDIIQFNLNLDGDNNVDEAFAKLQDMLKYMLDKHAPKKQRTIRINDFHCMSPKLRKAILIRNQARNRFFKHRSQHNLAVYRKNRNSVTLIKREETKNYFQEKCQGGTTNKDFWKAVKPIFSQTKTKSDSIPLREGNEIITENKQVCQIFNDYFVQIGGNIGIAEDNSKLTVDIITDYADHPSVKVIKDKVNQPRKIFDFSNVTEYEVKKVIKNLSAKKASGYDEIPVKLIKMVSEVISKPITQIANLCISQQQFPSGMKKANITPLYKKKDKLNKENYRSVNLLPALSKILEKLLYSQIYTYIKPMFHDYLSGFRKGFGCQDILIRMTEDWRKSLDLGESIGIVAIDLSKAFDCMSHGLLIAKTDAYGFSMQACNLLKSYLLDRSQRVKIGDVHSNWVESRKGVPQGSILGPLLFNIFINDFLYHNFNSNVYNYADDNTLSFSDKTVTNIVEKLQNDCAVAMEWFNANFMKANAEKFQLMFLNRFEKDVNETLNLNNCQIESSKSINILGIEIDDKLNFNNQIDNLCCKAGKQINALKRMKYLLDKQCKCIIYNSFVSSNFNYSPITWMFSNKLNFEKLNKTNKRALRFVVGNDMMPYDDLCMQEKQLDMEKRCIKAAAIQMYKIKKEISPTYLQTLFAERELPYDMRDNDTFTIPTFNTINYGKRSFRYYGAKLWSEIPNSIKENVSLEGFKSAITKWLYDESEGSLKNLKFL